METRWKAGKHMKYPGRDFGKSPKSLPDTAAAPENRACLLYTSIRELTRSGMTILIVTHEMGFAREVSDRVLFICDGVIKEEGTPEQIFTCPHEPSTIKFLSMVL